MHCTLVTLLSSPKEGLFKPKAAALVDQYAFCQRLSSIGRVLPIATADTSKGREFEGEGVRRCKAN